MLDKVIVEVYENTQLNTMNYILRIPRKDLLKLQLDKNELEMIREANGSVKLSVFLEGLAMVVRKIEEKEGN